MAKKDSPMIIKSRKLGYHYANALRGLRSVNPFLAGIIQQMIDNSFHAGYVFKFKEAVALMRILREMGYDKDLDSPEALSSDPNIFWNMIDYGLNTEPTDPVVKWNRAVYGILALYRQLREFGVFNESFIRHEKSVYNFVKYKSFSDFLHEKYKSRENYHVISRGAPSCTYVYLDYRSDYLHQAVLETFSRHHCIARELSTLANIVSTFESLFETPESVRSYHDLTPDKLDYAIRTILNRFPGAKDEELCISWMKALFCLWSDAVLAHPDHDFFAGSFLYTVEFIVNSRSAVWLGKRYIPIAAGMNDKLPPLFRVLFIVRRNDLRTASGNRYMQRSVDFSDFPDTHWRQIMVNYADACVANGNTSYKSVRMYSRWMMERKRGTKKPYHIMYMDMVAYRVYLQYSTTNYVSANTIIVQVRLFLDWATKSGFLTAESGYLKGFKAFKQRYEINPKSLSGSEIAAIHDALVLLAEEKKDNRYLLSATLSEMLLYTPARIGSLCSIALPDISFKDDGTCIITSKEKNRGKGKVELEFCVRATDLLREAMEISRVVRQACPVGGPKDQVFLYQCHSAIVPFAVMDVTRFNNDLKEACTRANIEKVSSGNYRDTYHTNVRKFCRKNHLSELEEQALTGHARRTSTNAYDDIDLRDILESTRGIVIGKKG